MIIMIIIDDVLIFCGRSSNQICRNDKEMSSGYSPVSVRGRSYSSSESTASSSPKIGGAERNVSERKIILTPITFMLFYSPPLYRSSERLG